MTIPPNSSAAYLIPGLKHREEMKVQQPVNLTAYVQQIEELYELPPGAFNQRWPATGKAKRSVAGVPIAEIRKAVVMFACGLCGLKPERVASVLGISRTTIYPCLKGARDLLSVNDPRFTALYQRVKEVGQTLTN